VAHVGVPRASGGLLTTLRRTEAGKAFTAASGMSKKTLDRRRERSSVAHVEAWRQIVVALVPRLIAPGLALPLGLASQVQYDRWFGLHQSSIRSATSGGRSVARVPRGIRCPWRGLLNQVSHVIIWRLSTQSFKLYPLLSSVKEFDALRRAVTFDAGSTVCPDVAVFD
jgi:hypothetical protein